MSITSILDYVFYNKRMMIYVVLLICSFAYFKWL